MNKRDLYFDFLRGIAIIFVIGIHSGTKLSFDSTIGNIYVIIRQAIGCAVPIFLAISGYFMSQKVIVSSKNYFNFWKKQIPKIYIPCLFWAIPWLLLSLRAGNGIGYSIFLYITCGLSIFYFIALIIQYYILLPFLKNIKKTGLIISILISTVSILLISYLLAIKGISVPLILYAGPFPVWLVFFTLGCYLGKHNMNYPITPYSILFVLGLILCYYESYYLYPFHGKGFGIKFSAFFYSFFAIILLFSNQSRKLFNTNQPIVKWIMSVGQASFPIYLTHCLVLMVVNKVMPNIWFITWGATLVSTFYMIVIIKIILPSRWHYYLGIS